jgi:putative ABC transport system permease protein
MTFIDLVKTSHTNLLRNKTRTILTIIAIFVGSLTLTLTNGLGVGVRGYFDSQINSLGFQDSLIVTHKNSRTLGNKVQEYEGNKRGNLGFTLLSSRDVDAIQSIKNVTRVERSYAATPDYVFSDKVDKKFELQVSHYFYGINLNLKAGRNIDKDETNAVVITQPYAAALGFKTPQDAIDQPIHMHVKSLKGNEKTFDLTIRGVLQNALVDNGSFQTSGKTVQEMAIFQADNIEGATDYFIFGVARLVPGASADIVIQAKKELANKGYEARTIQDQIGTVSKAIDIFQIALNVFGGIALLAASFGIINTLLMAVHERTREIGLMKALGTHRRTIFALFSMEAIIIGFWGSLLGAIAAMGLGSVLNTYATDVYLKDFEGLLLFRFPFTLIATIMGLIMVIAFIAGVVPARRAARLDAIDALKYE